MVSPCACRRHCDRRGACRTPRRSRARRGQTRRRRQARRASRRARHWARRPAPRRNCRPPSGTCGSGRYGHCRAAPSSDNAPRRTGSPGHGYREALHAALLSSPSSKRSARVRRSRIAAVSSRTLSMMRPQLAFFLGQAVLALLVREAAGAGDEGERSVGEAQDVAIADVDRREREPVAAVAPAHGRDEAGARQLGENDGQELGRDVLRLGDLGKLDRSLAIMAREMLEGPDRIARALRKHAYHIGRECGGRKAEGATKYRRATSSRRKPGSHATSRRDARDPRLAPG